jgi:hypothetical protein
MSRRISLLLAGVCLIIALAVGGFAWLQYDRLVASAAIVVVAQPIPPYTIITASHLTQRELPRTLLQEPIYQTAAEAIGKLTTVPLLPGHVIYRDQAVPPAQFRLAPDPRLAVVSFPIRPERAVGGRGVQIGSRIDIYRIALAPPSQSGETLTADQVLRRPGAAVEVLATDVLVVDVGGSRGEAVSSQSPREADSTLESSARIANSQVVPLSIITVAVSPTVAAQIVQLAGEEKSGDYQIWVGLSPLEREPMATPPPAMTLPGPTPTPVP